MRKKYCERCKLCSIHMWEYEFEIVEISIFRSRSYLDSIIFLMYIGSIVFRILSIAILSMREFVHGDSYVRQLHGRCCECEKKSGRLSGSTSLQRQTHNTTAT